MTQFTARVLVDHEVPGERASAELIVPGARIVARNTPLPAQAIADLAARAWYWPEARATLERHAAVLEVSLAAEVGNPLARALALSRAVASIASRAGAIAVIWDATELAHSPAHWIEQMEDATEEDLPLFLWIAFEGDESTGGVRNLRTRGAQSFGVMEVEVQGSRRDGEEVLEHVCDVLLVALTSSVPLESGDQVEVTRGKVRVRVEPSSRNDGSRVYRLRLP